MKSEFDAKVPRILFKHVSRFVDLFSVCFMHVSRKKIYFQGQSSCNHTTILDFRFSTMVMGMENNRTSVNVQKEILQNCAVLTLEVPILNTNYPF